MLYTGLSCEVHPAKSRSITVTRSTIHCVFSVKSPRTWKEDATGIGIYIQFFHNDGAMCVHILLTYSQQFPAATALSKVLTAEDRSLLGSMHPFLYLEQERFPELFLSLHCWRKCTQKFRKPSEMGQRLVRKTVLIIMVKILSSTWIYLPVLRKNIRQTSSKSWSRNKAGANICARRTARSCTLGIDGGQRKEQGSCKGTCPVS